MVELGARELSGSLGVESTTNVIERRKSGTVTISNKFLLKVDVKNILSETSREINGTSNGCQ